MKDSASFSLVKVRLRTGLILDASSAAAGGAFRFYAYSFLIARARAACTLTDVDGGDPGGGVKEGRIAEVDREDKLGTVPGLVPSRIERKCNLHCLPWFEPLRLLW